MDEIKEIYTYYEKPHLLKAYLVLLSFKYQTPQEMSVEEALGKIDQAVQIIRDDMVQSGIIDHEEEKEREIVNTISTEALIKELKKRHGYANEDKVSPIFTSDEKQVAEFFKKHN